MGVPEFLTVEEAAAVLRIGRSSAYEQARRFLATGGLEGLPVVRMGRLLRVPRARLEAMAGGVLDDHVVGAAAGSRPAVEPPPAAQPRRRVRRLSPMSVRQEGLFEQGNGSHR